ncbi:MAG: glycosyltransferase [Candidatus Kapabacteria bacterium]|nr:glycosyltransferase [Candidatus Kapabacteria bacterium]
MKSYHLLRHLAKENDVTLVAFSFGGLPTASEVKAIEDIGVKVYPIKLNPLISGLMTGLRLPLEYPLEISFYLTSEFRRTVDKLCAENDYDLGIAFFMRTAEYLKDKSFKKILIAEDCRVLYQSRSFTRSDNILQKIVRIWEVMKLKKYEPKITSLYDFVTLVTKEDISEMHKGNPNLSYRLVTNGVDIDRYAPHCQYKEREKNIIFTGKLSVWANTMMAIKIANEIMPRIRKEVPDVKLQIVGANPPKSVKSLSNDFVEVHPNVPDLAKYYTNARIFLHPHDGASGIQNKLLEAMASGCAVVTTPTGNQGIYAEHGKDAMIAKNDEELVKHTLTLLNDEDLAVEMSENARSRIINTHTWEVVFEQIDGVIRELFNEE